MLEVFTRILIFIIMNVVNFYLIKELIDPEGYKINLKKVICIIIFIIIQLILYRIEYSVYYSIFILIANIVFYKYIFRIEYITSFIVNIIVTIVTAISDLLVSLITMNFMNINEMRTNYSLSIVTTIVVCFLSILIIKIFQKQLMTINKIILKKEKLKITLYSVILIFSIVIIAYNLSINYYPTANNILNISLLILYTILIIILIKDKKAHSDLINQYDNLFTYIQNFEEWIERDQLNRHEYKNQLAVLRLMAKNKQLKAKIDEILDDTVDINNEIINELSTLPKGGIKGLMYYKAAVAQKQKINLTVNVSLQKNTYLKQLTTDHLKDMNRLIGIYFDNAIEAAKDTKKKIILAEIYEFDSKVKFVISNTFKISSNIDNKHQKGKSTKGAGRGNGLYFASKIIKKYNRIEEKQEIIDDYYIQSITLNKRKDLVPKN